MVVVAIVMLLSTPVGFVLARYRIPFKGAILLLFLLPQTCPQQPVFVNLMLVFTRLDLAGTIDITPRLFCKHPAEKRNIG